MRAQLVIVSNPLQPHASRKVTEIRRRRRLSTLAPKTTRPFICVVNGEPVLRKNWSRCIEDNDTVAFVTLVQGGGGGGGSNPIATVAMLAVMVAAPWAATSLLDLQAGSMMAMAATVGIEFAATALVNALFGPPVPPKPSLIPNPSPTYTLSARGNSARLQEPIPVHYGRMMVYPSYAAQPYTEYAGNEQYLYQLLCLGQGSFSIEAIRLLTTDINAFPGVTIEVVQPGASVTLFPTNVVTSGLVTGQELMATNEPGAPPSVTLGPYDANAPATQTNAIAIDIVLPRGLFYANDQGGLDTRTVTWLVEAQLIDDNGTALGNWFTLGNETLTLATNTPQRLSYRYTVAIGRYQVRATRANAKDLSSRAANDLIWGAMRAYLPGSQQYGDVTLIAVRMLATNVLSSATSNKINVIATRMLPTWNPTTGWSAPVATRSITWALADCCKAAYSAGLSDINIDLNALYALDQVWASRGDYFDAVYDTRTTFWNALTQIARAGRAKPFPQSGIYHFVRDQAQTMPVALFSTRNIAKGSFKVQYLMPTEATPDSVIVQYMDSTTWLPATVQCTLAGSTATKPAQLQLFGVTDRNQAWREGMYAAACNRYRRTLPQFQTEMEGFIPSFGDLVAISHDMPQWGQSGDVLDVAGLSLVNGVVTATGPIEITVSEPMTYTAGQQHYIAFRKVNGSMSGPWACSEGSSPEIVVLSQTPDMIPYAGSSMERTHFSFGPASSGHSANALVRSVRPRNDHIVEMMFVNDDPNVHTADGTGTAPAATWNWLLPAISAQAPITGLDVVQSGTPAAPILSVSWQPAAGADHYWVQASYDGGQSWTNITEPSTPGCTFPVPPGAVMIRVAAVGLTVSAWVSWTGTAGASIAPPANVLNLALAEPFTGPICKIAWDATARASSWTVEVWAGSPLALVRTKTVSVPHFEYSAADATADGGPWRNLTFNVIANGSGGVTSDIWSSLSVANPQVAILNGVSVIGLLASLEASFTKPSDSDFAGVMIWASPTTGFTPGSANLVYDGPNNPINIAVNPGSPTFYVRLAAYDQWGKDSLNITGEFNAATSLIVTGQLSAGAITMSQIAAGAVGSDQLSASAVTAAKIAAGAVGTGQIAKGAVTNALIASGAVGLSQFANGLLPVSIVAALPALPNTAYPQGSVVTLTTDNKLYRSTGAAWTKSTDGADIVANSITAAQIAAGAITSAQIAAGTIVAANIAAGTISGALIAAGAIAAGNIAASTITSDKMVAGTITSASGILADAAITSAKIANLSVQTIHIADSAVTSSAFASSNGFSRYFTAGSIAAGSADDIFSSLTFSTQAGDDITVEGFCYFTNSGGGNAPTAVTIKPHLVLDGADTTAGQAALWSVYNGTSHLGLLMRSRISGDGNPHTLTLNILASWAAFTNSANSQYSVSNCILSVFIRRK